MTRDPTEREAPRPLGELRAVELIYEKSIYPELAYMFKHALTHDVAYESLLKQRRRALHRRVGEVIEELYPDRLAEFYETLAWHYTQGEAWAKAVAYLLSASDKARAQFAYVEATRHARDAVEILDRHGGSEEAKLRGLEALGGLESRQEHLDLANQAYDRAVEVASDAAVKRRVMSKGHRPGATARDGARIAYYEHGTRGPTLLLMHPVAYGIATLQPLVESLSDEFRIVTVEPRGTGRSDPYPDIYYTRDHVLDARAVVEAIGSPRVVLVGISRGGTIATHFATAYPDLSEKLILIGVSPARNDAPGYPGPVDLKFWKRVGTLVAAGDHEEAIRTFQAQVMSEPGSQKLIEGSLRRWQQVQSEVLWNFFLLDDPGRDIRPLLSRLQVPTLVMHSEEDRVNPLEAGRFWPSTSLSCTCSGGAVTFPPPPPQPSSPRSSGALFSTAAWTD